MSNPLEDPTSYKKLIEKLIFLVHKRPDLSFVVQHLSQFSQNPCQNHYKAALHVIQYLKWTYSQGLLFNNAKIIDWKLIVILIMPRVPLPESQSVDTLFFLEEHLFHGNPKIRSSLLFHMMKQNTDQWDVYAPNWLG